MLFEKAIPIEARDAYRRDAIAGILCGIFSGSIFPFAAFIARDQLHAGLPLIGLMAASPCIGGLLSLLATHFMEGKRKMPFVSWPGGFARALFFLTPFVGGPLSFALLITSSQSIASLTGPPYSAVLKEIYPDQSRCRIMAYVRVGMAAAAICSTQLVGGLLHSWGYKIMFPLAAIAGMASSATFNSIKTAPIPQAEQKRDNGTCTRFMWDTLSLLKDDRNYASFLLATMIFGFGNMMAFAVLPIYQVDRLHITASSVAILTNTTNAVWLLSYPFWGRFVDERSPVRGMMIAIICTCVLPINYFFAPSVWWVLPAAVATGLSMGSLEMSYFASILSMADEKRISQYQSLHAFCTGLRGITAPFCGTALVGVAQSMKVDIRWVFPLCLMLMLIGGTILFGRLRKLM